MNQRNSFLPSQQQQCCWVYTRPASFSKAVTHKPLFYNKTFECINPFAHAAPWGPVFVFDQGHQMNYILIAWFVRKVSESRWDCETHFCYT